MAAIGSDGPVFSSSRVLRWSSMTLAEQDQFARFAAENNLAVRLARRAVERAPSCAAAHPARPSARPRSSSRTPTAPTPRTCGCTTRP